MDSYKDFASVYDSLIYEDIDYDGWSEIIIKVAKSKGVKFNNYLDLACGTGNMTEKISKYFKKTYAVDISTEMLTKAKEKFYNRADVMLLCQDITNLELNKKFDLVTCSLDGLNYITDEKKLYSFFSSLNNYIEKEGLFIFDINSYYKLSSVLGNNTYSYDSEDITYVWDNNFENDLVDMYLTFFVRAEGHYNRFDEHHRERAYRETFIEDMLYKTGYEVLHKYDSYSETEVSPETERIVYILRRG